MVLGRYIHAGIIATQVPFSRLPSLCILAFPSWPLNKLYIWICTLESGPKDSGWPAPRVSSKKRIVLGINPIEMKHSHLSSGILAGSGKALAINPAGYLDPGTMTT